MAVDIEQFELLVLRRSMDDKHLWDRLRRSGASMDDFSGYQARSLYAYLSEQYERYKVLPSVSGFESMSGAQLPDIDMTSDYLFDEFQKARLHVALSSGMMGVNEALRKNDPERALALWNEGRIKYRRSGTNAVNIQEVGRAALRQQEEMQDGRISSIPYYWPTLNKLTGGIQYGKIHFLCARPGIGKSMMALIEILHALSLRHNSLFISPEMTLADIGERMICLEEKIGMGALTHGFSSLQFERGRRRVEEGWSDYQYSSAFLDSKQDLSPGQLESYLDDTRPEFIIFDSIYMMDFGGRDDTENMIEGIKWLHHLATGGIAEEYSPAMLAISQLSRSMVAAMTDKIEWYVDALLYLNRDDDDLEHGRVEIQPQKVRKGDRTSIGKLYFHWRFGDDMRYDEYQNSKEYSSGWDDPV